MIHLFYHHYLEPALEMFYVYVGIKLLVSSLAAAKVRVSGGSSRVLGGVASRKEQLRVSSFPFVFFSPTCLLLSSGLTCLLLVALWFERVSEQATWAFEC